MSPEEHDHAHDDEDDAGVTLDAGMPVTNTDGDHLGALALVLVDEETEEAAFLLVSEDGTDDTPSRLVPAEVVDDVTEGGIVLDVESFEFDRLPSVAPKRDPSPAEMALAYRVLGLEEEEEDADEGGAGKDGETDAHAA